MKILKQLSEASGAASRAVIMDEYSDGVKDGLKIAIIQLKRVHPEAAKLLEPLKKKTIDQLKTYLKTNEKN